MEINPKLADLNLFIEEERFVEYMGNFFCVAESCEGCKHINDCEHTEGTIEATENVAVRQAVGVDNNLCFAEDGPTLWSLSTKEHIKEAINQGCKWLHKDGVLPDSKNMIYKIVQFDAGHTDYILYNPDDDKNYCIDQNGCSNCKLFKECKCEVVVGRKNYTISSLDLRSQEPRANTFVAREPEWVKVFQNDTLREKPELLMALNNLFTNHPELQVDVDTDKKYWAWLDSVLFYDKSLAYELGILVMRLQKEPDSKALRKELNSLVDEIINDYQGFKYGSKKNK